MAARVDGVGRRCCSWVMAHLLARELRGHVGTRCGFWSCVCPWQHGGRNTSGSACPCPHQPNDSMPSSLSCTLQWVHASGAAVSSPPAPVSHHQGWSHLGTVVRAARSSPSQGVSSLVALRDAHFPCFCHAMGDKPSEGASPVHTVTTARSLCTVSVGISVWGWMHLIAIHPQGLGEAKLTW